MAMLNLARLLGGEENSLDNKQFVGIVIDNKDPDKLQRVKLRIPGIHKDLKDEDIPWVFPGTANTQNNTGGTSGQLGPIPPVGSKLHMRYLDNTLYHGMYMGTVTTKDQKVKSLTSGEYGKDYPNVFGNEDPSGNLSAVNTKRDTVENTHVSGTGHQIDGKGNLHFKVNGGYSNPNKDASEKFSKGVSGVIVGNMDITVKGQVNISCTDKANIKANGDVLVNSKGKITIQSAQDLLISCKTTLKLIADSALNLIAPSITASVPIVLGGSGQAANPDQVQDPDAISPRGRPVPISSQRSTTK